MSEEKTNQNLDNVDIKNKEVKSHVADRTQKNVNKKGKTRMYIVLLFILLVAIVVYIVYRGEYLEILEIGEEYLSIFWQNVNYTAITFGINFVLLFFIIYINNYRLK